MNIITVIILQSHYYYVIYKEMGIWARDGKLHFESCWIEYEN